jgi:hypothetical protein
MLILQFISFWPSKHLPYLKWYGDDFTITITDTVTSSISQFMARPRGGGGGVWKHAPPEKFAFAKPRNSFFFLIFISDWNVVGKCDSTPSPCFSIFARALGVLECSRDTTCSRLCFRTRRIILFMITSELTLPCVLEYTEVEFAA